MIIQCMLIIMVCPSINWGLFLRKIENVFGPDKMLQRSCEAGGGQCVFDLSCRLSYGRRLGDCGGFYQVCCAPSSSFPVGRHFPGTTRDLLNKLGGDSWTKVNPAPEKCGRPEVAARRVVGGSEAGFGRFPWMALVRGTSNRCGGALINSDWVLTAGHCVRDHDSLFGSKYRVYLGEYILYAKSEPLPRQKFWVDKIILHPLYQFTPQADRYDVALLKLDKKATMMPHVSPVCLPSPHEPTPSGIRGHVSGWGATDPDSQSRPNMLQAVDVVTINNTVCENWHRNAGIRVTIYPEMMCAGHREGGRDACQGDSGGPLMTKDSDGKWTLVGLVSAGYSCAKPGQPGIYHRVSETVGWINHVTSYQEENENSVR